MRQSILFSCSFFIYSTGLLAQVILTGLVIDGNTRQAVPFATVYFDGTTNGLTTDDNGRFNLSLEGIELPAVLVVSHISYTTKTMDIEAVEAELTLVLQVRDQIVSTVIVKDRNQRQQNLEEFRRLFLGADTWGYNARIRNEEHLFFDRDYVSQKVNIRSDYMRKMVLQANPKNVEWAPDLSYYIYDKALNLKASAGVPLVIELPDLGYNLQLDLVSFQAEYEQGRTGYLGHYYFVPKEGVGGKARPRHQKNRRRAYFNSSLHFLRSLFAGTLTENGFQLFERITNGPNGKENVQAFDIAPYLQVINGEKIEVRNLAGRSFVVLYYGDQQGRPLPENKWKKVRPVQSGLHIGQKVCTIRADGTIGADNLFFSGYMGSHGLAWVLPSDFDLSE